MTCRRTARAQAAAPIVTSKLSLSLNLHYYVVKRVKKSYLSYAKMFCLYICWFVDSFWWQWCVEVSNFALRQIHCIKTSAVLVHSMEDGGLKIVGMSVVFFFFFYLPIQIELDFGTPNSPWPNKKKKNPDQFR